MIPAHQQQAIVKRLSNEIGYREDVGHFVYTFTALPEGHDLEYAFDELKGDGDIEYKKAVNIVLEGIIA